MKVAGICLVTEDVARLKDFYEKILAQSAQGQGDYVTFDLGIHLSICGISMEAAIAPNYQPPRLGGRNILEILVDDLEDLYKRSLQETCIIKPLKEEAWGTTSFWIADPEGHVVSFIQV